jgi:soluble lytic murein transglycosylase-like protein
MGLTQVLPSTGRQMAQRLGVPWREDLMTGKTAEASDYQRKIGGAYLDEALDKTGTVEGALRYYHSGPDRRRWGPKTRAYSSGVLSLLGI